MKTSTWDIFIPMTLISPVLTLDSANEITFLSGNAMGLIKYVLTNPSDEYTLEAVADVEWINNFSLKDDIDPLSRTIPNRRAI